MADHDRIEGAAKNLGGKVKEAAGKVTGDTKLQAEGKADQVEGKVQNAVGGVKDSLRDKDRPLSLLFTECAKRRPRKRAAFSLGQSGLSPQSVSDRPFLSAPSTGRHSELKPPWLGRGRQSISRRPDGALIVRDCGPHWTA